MNHKRRRAPHQRAGQKMIYGCYDEQYAEQVRQMEIERFEDVPDRHAKARVPRKQHGPYRIEWRTDPARAQSNYYRENRSGHWHKWRSYAKRDVRDRALKVLARKYLFWQFRGVDDDH